MLMRFTPLALIRGSENPVAVQDGRGTCPRRRRSNRTWTRARFQLEGLEDRCLLSGISSITEFPLPSPQGQGNLTGITVGPDGNLWFTDWASNSIGMINPTTHAISLFPLPTAGAGPEGITVGPDGNLWFTEWFITKNNTNQIGEINPTTHAISEFVVPRNMVHPDGITAGPDGNLWFTCEEDPYVASFNPTTHAVTQYPTNNGDTHSITAGPNGNLWFGTNHGSVDEINPSTGAQTDVAENLSGAAPGTMGITTGPDGNFWVTSDANVVAMINPTTGASSQFTIPTANAGSFAITSGPDGNLWFTDVNNGDIDSINPTTDAISEYAIPYTGSLLLAITMGPDGNLWFTDTGNNAIGVATLTANQLVVTAQPPASVTAGSGFGLTVTAENSSGNPITSFDGTVTVALASNPGGATLGGTLTATASDGVATFSGLTLTTAASGYTLDVSASGLGAGASNAITVIPAAASQVVITTEPPSTVKVSAAFGLQASIEDQYGNVVTTDTNTVKVAFANNPTGATLSGTLSVAASQGIATFSGLEINKTGTGYTLQVTSSGLSPATSTAINVTKTGKAAIAAPQPVATPAPDPLLAPLVFDSPRFLDSLGLKKRTRGI
jgi:streptogramin lyase